MCLQLRMSPILFIPTELLVMIADLALSDVRDRARQLKDTYLRFECVREQS